MVVGGVMTVLKFCSDAGEIQLIFITKWMSSNDFLIPKTSEPSKIEQTFTMKTMFRNEWNWQCHEKLLS